MVRCLTSTWAARFSAGSAVSAILEVVPDGSEGIKFGRLAELVSAGMRSRLGSLSCYMTTVKLDLGERGETERIPGSRPQMPRCST